MSKTKKVLLMLTAYALVAALAVGGTLAYLTDRDSEVNTFTVGDVAIDLTEEFQQRAELIPGQNVQKEVAIENIGKNDAWVWYTIAFPKALDLTDAGNTILWTGFATENHDNAGYAGANDGVDEWLIEYSGAPYLKYFTKDGVEMVEFAVLYQQPLAPNTATPTSLECVYLDKTIDIDPQGNLFRVNNGVAEAIDWNVHKNGNPYVFVNAYAVQTEGFASVQAAYAAYSKQWGDKGGEYATVVSTAAGLRDAMKTDGANIVLTNDITVTADDTTGYGQHMFLANGKSVTVNLNGNDITVAEDASQIGSVFTAANGGKIILTGDGNVQVKNGRAFIGWTLNNSGSIEVRGGNYFGNGHEGNNALFYVQDNTGKIDVYGGKFTYPVADNDNWGFNTHNNIGNKLVIEIHEGALLQHEQFQYGDNSRIQLAKDCVLEETVIDGETWYQVVKNTPAEVIVTPQNLASVDFTQDNAVFTFSGSFGDAVTFSVPNGLNQTFDATNATFPSNGTVTVNAPGVAHAYSSLSAQRAGVVTVKGFKTGTLNVLAYNNEAVNIVGNTVNAMSVIGGNFALNIEGNTVDGNFSTYTDGENQANDYGISLRITDYELAIKGNTVTDAYSHAIGINGRQGEASSDWGSCGANNKITAFTGNRITVNTTGKTGRAALKIWCDQAYAPYATSGHTPNAAATKLMADIVADTSNVITLGDTHTAFNIFDYKQ